MICKLFEKIDELADGLICNMAEYRIPEGVVDRRAFRKCYIDEDGTVLTIDICNHQSALHFAGFEYIDDDQSKIIGSYVFFSAHSGRIASIISSLTDNEESEEGDNNG